MKRNKSGSVKLIVISTVLAWQLLFPFAAAQASEASHVLALTANKAAMSHNGQELAADQPVVEKDNLAYIPLKSVALLYGFSVTYDAAAKETVASKEDMTLRFKAGAKTIDVNGTAVESAGEIFSQKGSLMIPLRTWADITESKLKVSGSEYTLSWKEVIAEPSPPVANFKTDKSVYRMGENIKYEDLSEDEHSEIVKRTWTGKASAFFEPGEHEVTLRVENEHGKSDTITHKITVTNDSLYTPHEHGLLYAEPGSKFPVDRNDVLVYEPVNYTTTTSPMTFVRSNSPEHLYGEEGIGYQDTLSGSFRINIHNQNRSQQDISVYLLATNHGTSDANVTLNAFGMGGPTKYVSTSGKTAVSRFLDSLAKSEPVRTMKVPAGETVVVLPEISKSPMKGGLTMTSYSEIHTDQELEFSVVILNPDKDPIEALPELPVLKRDGKHVRGTFPEGNRTFHVNQVLGDKPQRMIIGDNDLDTFVTGSDSVTGLEEVNIGNTGVLYDVELQVAPHTLVGLNARGGHYAGAFLVNGKVVNMLDGSILINPEEVGVLHRTGDREETVHLTFVLASGSNLPIHMLFMPVPESKE